MKINKYKVIFVSIRSLTIHFGYDFINHVENLLMYNFNTMM